MRGVAVFLAAGFWGRGPSCPAACRVSSSQAFYRGALPTAPTAQLDRPAPREHFPSTYCLCSVGPQVEGKMGEARQLLPGAQSRGGHRGEQRSPWGVIGGTQSHDPHGCGEAGWWVGRWLRLGCGAVTKGGWREHDVPDLASEGFAWPQCWDWIGGHGPQSGRLRLGGGGCGHPSRKTVQACAWGRETDSRLQGVGEAGTLPVVALMWGDEEGALMSGLGSWGSWWDSSRFALGAQGPPLASGPGKARLSPRSVRNLP